MPIPTDQNTPEIVAIGQNEYVQCAMEVLEELQPFPTIHDVPDIFFGIYSGEIMARMSCSREDAYRSIFAYLELTCRPTFPAWKPARDYSLDQIIDHGVRHFVAGNISANERSAITRVYNDRLEAKKLPEQ